MKKTMAVLAALALLLTCACGKAETPETTAPATRPVTTASPTTAVPTTKAPEPETVNPYVFHLEELPDVGRYRAKSVPCFYAAPLDDFKPSDEYGAVIPYRLNSDIFLSRVGFMTTDGRVITGPVYESVSLRTVGDSSLYFAERQMLNVSPDRDSEDYYQKTSQLWEDNVIVQLIPVDGSDCVSFQGENVSLFHDISSGISLLQTGSVRSEGISASDTCRIYDTDCHLVADFTDWIEEYGNGIAVVGADETGFALHASKRDDDGMTRHYILLTEGTVLTKKILLNDSYPFVRGVFGNRIFLYSNVYDFDGNPVFESHHDFKFFSDPGGFMTAEPEEGNLIRFCQDGTREDYAIPQAEDCNLRSLKSGGKEYIAVEYGENRYNGNWSYTVYDAGMRPVYSLPYHEDVDLSFSWEEENSGDDLIVIGHRRKTEIRTVTGELLAEAPFREKNVVFGECGSVCLQGESGRCAVFSRSTRKITELTLKGDCWPVYSDGMIFVYRFRASENSGERIRIVDLATEETLHDFSGSFSTQNVNGKRYYSLLTKDSLRVYNEKWQMLAEIPDSYFA